MILQNHSISPVRNRSVEPIAKRKAINSLSRDKVMQAKTYQSLPDSALMKVYFAGIKTDPNKNKLSFTGKPWVINLESLGVFDWGSLTAEEAIKVFNKFKEGNYLDITQSTWNPSREPSYQAIRKENLEFLDRVTSPTEKRKFINYYNNLTGFPNLAEVSSKIKTEFTNAVSKAVTTAKYFSSLEKSFDVVRAGYNDTCSVGRNRAFPGSDIDGAYIILRGTDNPEIDKSIIDSFKRHLWNSTDQRILSYNHEAAFPQIYTMNQVEKLLSVVNEKTRNLNISADFSRFQNLMSHYHSDYVEANPFFIKLCKQFPNKTTSDLDISNPSKENIKNFGFFIETLGRGRYFQVLHDTSGDSLVSKVFSSDAYKLTNLSQIHALDNCSPKGKILARGALENNFNNWSVDTQYDFVKTMIKASCGENERDKFPEYFKTSGNSFEPLLKALGKP